MDSVEQADPLIGASLGNYKVVERLGSGGMGVVYLGEHKRMKRRAALKVLQSRYSAENEIVERFFTEAKAATSINDPGIVQVFDCDYHDGRPYIAMERLEGEGLDARLVKKRRLGVHETLRLGRQIAKSLAAAHRKGVIHRDLKPANVFLVHDSEVSCGERSKILDFGIAKLLDDTGMTTEIGTVVGTPAYMSPEQCRGDAQVDPRSDIYSLGCVLFHMLTGHPPFQAASRDDFFLAHIHSEALAPSSIVPSCPPSVDQLVKRCLAKSPADRYATMDDLAVAMKQLLGALPAESVARADTDCDGFAMTLSAADSVAAELDALSTVAMPSPAADVDGHASMTEPAPPRVWRMRRAMRIGRATALVALALAVAAAGIAALTRARVLHMTVAARAGAAIGAAVSIPITVDPPDATLAIVDAPRSLAATLGDGGERSLSVTPTRSGTFTVQLRARAEGYPDALAQVELQVAPYDLVLAGSNTIGGIDAASGRGLARDLVIELMKSRRAAVLLDEREVPVDNEDEKDRRLTFRLPDGKTVRVLIRPHGSQTAVGALTSSDPDLAADVGMSSHPQPRLHGFWESVIAVDAVAVIVHRDNPIRELTLEQLRNIFGPNPDGERSAPIIADWSQIPRAISGPIHTYGRDKKSGTTECFRERTGIDKVLASLGRDPEDRIPYSGPAPGEPGHDGYEDTQKVIESVKNDPQGIGYIGRAASWSAEVNVVRIRPAGFYSAFSPTPTAIATLEYSMARELYLHRPVKNARPLAVELIDFALSDEGQRVVKNVGFIGFRTDELVDQRFSLGDHAPRALKDKVAGYDRIRLSFRYTSDSNAPDTISQQNILLLRKLLDRPENRDRRLFVVGSADSIGDQRRNLDLSRERARNFKAYLEGLNVRNVIETDGYGKAYLLYDDHGDRTSLEAQRNRRVEIYIERDRRQ